MFITKKRAAAAAAAAAVATCNVHRNVQQQNSNNE